MLWNYLGIVGWFREERCGQLDCEVSAGPASSEDEAVFELSNFSGVVPMYVYSHGEGSPTLKLRSIKDAVNGVEREDIDGIVGKCRVQVQHHLGDESSVLSSIDIHLPTPLVCIHVLRGVANLDGG